MSLFTRRALCCLLAGWVLGTLLNPVFAQSETGSNQLQAGEVRLDGSISRTDLARHRLLMMVEVVVSADASGGVVSAPGPRWIQLQSSTSLWAAGAEPGTAANQLLRTGAELAVIGREQAGGSLAARLVVVLNSPGLRRRQNSVPPAVVQRDTAPEAETVPAPELLPPAVTPPSSAARGARSSLAAALPLAELTRPGPEAHSVVTVPVSPEPQTPPLPPLISLAPLEIEDADSPGLSSRVPDRQGARVLPAPLPRAAPRAPTAATPRQPVATELSPRVVRIEPPQQPPGITPAATGAADIRMAPPRTATSLPAVRLPAAPGTTQNPSPGSPAGTRVAILPPPTRPATGPSFPPTQTSPATHDGEEMLRATAWQRQANLKQTQQQIRYAWFSGGYPGQKAVALTFDDGPHPERTPVVLDILKRAGVPATFFVIGRNAEKHPGVLWRLLAEGHELGNHTFSHRQGGRLTLAEWRTEIETTNRVLTKITGSAPRWFRAPGCRYSPEALQVIEEQGMVRIDTTNNSSDWDGRSAASIVSRVVSRLAPGQIILMHEAMPETARALPQLIETLRREGYIFVTVSELALQAQADPGFEPLYCPPGQGIVISP